MRSAGIIGIAGDGRPAGDFPEQQDWLVDRIEHSGDDDAQGQGHQGTERLVAGPADANQSDEDGDSDYQGGPLGLEANRSQTCWKTVSESGVNAPSTRSIWLSIARTAMPAM